MQPRRRSILEAIATGIFDAPSLEPCVALAYARAAREFISGRAIVQARAVLGALRSGI